MEKKLQELTEKIYSEGIEKAKTEADSLINTAKKTAEEQINKAKKEADHIISEAKKKAEEIIRNGQSEMKLAVNQSLSEVKQKITELITAKIVSNSVSTAVTDKNFMKKIIEISIKNFFADQSKGMDLEISLPDDQKAELENYLKTDAVKLLNGELKIVFDKNMDNGFKIGPADGSYKLSFTDKDFENFFKKYMRPKTVELLFGGK
ncbi:MAG: V-type ATP synthase subunit E [Candidatus Delongbacteria bacterium]|nr:V-type ATP synthase subunit E [Candidatus Delongbacteria bacterium]MCG2759624.1 V-type ATP synthase subunit E [Candidatus Delongbacteria bacterium]